MAIKESAIVSTRKTLLDKARHRPYSENKKAIERKGLAIYLFLRWFPA